MAGMRRQALHLRGLGDRASLEPRAACEARDIAAVINEALAHHLLSKRIDAHVERATASGSARSRRADGAWLESPGAQGRFTARCASICSLTIRLRSACPMGFWIQRLPVVARKCEALDVKVPPVRKTIRSAWAGARAATHS